MRKKQQQQAPKAEARTRAEPVRDRLTGAIAQQILSGRYAPRGRMPTESELGDEFGVSRTALRESIRTLAGKGLVEARPRTGTVVRAKDDWNRLDPEVLAWMETIEPDFDFICGLVEARLVIEPAAAELAALRATGADLAAIEAGFNRMRESLPSDLEECVEADEIFHVAILQASHNPVFANFGSLIRAGLRNAFRLTTSASDNFRATLDAHGEVLSAIRFKRPDDARNRMAALLAIAVSDLQKLAAKELLPSQRVKK